MTGKYLSSGNLKIIAAASMLTDHIGYCVLYWFTQNEGTLPYSVYEIFRTVGRLAFPLYCFLLAEGFVHTRNRAKYALRLALFAVISEIPYDLMCRCTVLSFDVQNVYFTLLLGFLSMACIHHFAKRIHLSVITVALCCAAAHFFNTDYGAYGVILIVLMFSVRQAPPLIKTIAIAGGLIAKGLPPLSAIIPISMYNGEKGKAPKYFFYIFYPAHIIILCIIRYCIFGF